MINIHRLALVLKHANCSPPSSCKEDFYALKEAILEKFGERDSYDYQLIEFPCWGESRYHGCDEHCGKCGGTGIYHRFHVRLERWKLAGQVFHKPLERTAFSMGPVNIKGKINHPLKKLGFAAWRVLSLLFAPAFYLYLDQFKMDQRQLRRFKAVLAYVLEFPRDRWKVAAVKFSEIQEAAMKLREREAIPF